MLTRGAVLYSSSQKEEKKIHTLVENAEKSLLEIYTVFPWDFFPDTLIIDPFKVNYIHRSFFLSEQVTSMLIENIRHISVEAGPLFAKLVIVDSTLSPFYIALKPLWKSEALQAQSILQGMIATKKHAIDPNVVTAAQDVESLERIGQSSN